MYLTLVYPRIRVHHVFDPQGPIVAAVGPDEVEPAVRGEGHVSVGQNLPISPTHPRQPRVLLVEVEDWAVEIGRAAHLGSHVLAAVAEGEGQVRPRLRGDQAGHGQQQQGPQHGHGALGLKLPEREKEKSLISLACIFYLRRIKRQKRAQHFYYLTLLLFRVSAGFNEFGFNVFHLKYFVTSLKLRI